MRGGSITTLQHDLVDVMLAQTSLDQLSGCPDQTPLQLQTEVGDRSCVSYGVAWENRRRLGIVTSGWSRQLPAPGTASALQTQLLESATSTRSCRH